MTDLAQEFCHLFCAQTNTAIVGFDRQCRIVACNAAAEKTFAVRRAEILGREVAEVLPEQLCQRVGEMCQRAVTANAAGGFELSLAINDQPAVDLSVKVNPLYDDNQQTVAGVIWAEDITRIRKLERDLAAAERLSSLGTLAGGVAHHFNNILGGVSTFVSYALQSDDPRAARRALQMTAQAAERVGKITKSLLAFAQKDSGSQDLADLTEVVLTFASLVEKSLAGKHMEMDLQLHPTPVVPVRVDWMHTVLGNLLDNAEDAMPGGGRVEIQMGTDQEKVWLKFADQGQGMSPDTLAHVFEPFYTTKGATADGQQPRAGLGLAVVHGLIAEMGGKIEVESKPGSGTAFTIRFPRPDHQKPK